MHYKIIFLIISSDNESVYAQMKELAPKYYNLFSNKIKFFFIENRQLGNDQVIEDKNFLYINGSESFIPGIYQKSIKAIEYINKKYSYDYVIRTNLSTFWHMQNLFKLLDIKPKQRFAAGYAFQGFISGTGIIMSRDVGNLVTSTPNSNYIGDDLAISQTIQSHGIHLYDITEYKWGFLIPANDNLPSNCRYLNINDNDFSDILNFRIKNGGDRSIDAYYFNVLLQKLYNIGSVNNISVESVVSVEPVISLISVESVVEPVVSLVEPVVEPVIKPVNNNTILKYNQALLLKRRIRR
jgi:hypothetical protein